jgi:uncharacterized protein YlxW (UPF0749 family)
MTARRWRSQLVVALLACLLGFGLAVQVRTTQGNSVLGSARQDDLLRIISDLTARSERLTRETAELQATRDRLAAAGNQDSAAVTEARRRTDTLGVLAGSVAAHGPGVRVVVDDPGHKLRADFVVDVIQELRDAGAEAMMINGRRIGTSTYAVDGDVQIVLDGAPLAQPYTVVAIGDSATMATALKIPRGVVDTAQDAGARIHIEEATDVVVDALRPLSPPRYARPDPSG